ncbi:FAD-dependent monooxygenase [Actinosynnema sp. NPDC020468]|uniref:FAD-dependent monooxygenase n=1 Tax=Actinosynnema sp. NPDC020468 TaxID=3154488 RepID=UPI0033DA89CE
MGHVVVVGAGVTGLALAVELGLSGVDATVVDRGDRAGRAPGLAINAGAVELLDQRGLLDEVRAGAVELPSAHFALLPLDLDAVPGPRENTLLVGQTRLEEVLARHAVARGARLRRGADVVGVIQDAEGARVRFADGTQLAADYVVGADGRSSTVRSAAGIDFPGVDAPFHGLVGDVEVDPTRLTPDLIGVRYTESGGHYTAAPLAPGLLRLVTAEFGRPAPTGEVTTAELVAAARRLVRAELPVTGVRWAERYAHSTRNAAEYRRGRVFLAGDAAHVFFPLNGQGIETGLHDAVNLGWKLAAVLAGREDALLDTYHAERHPVGAWAGTTALAQVQLSRPAAEVAAVREVLGRLIALRGVSRFLLDAVTGRGVRYPVGGPGHPSLGARLPTAAVTTSRGATTVTALLRSGRGVLLDLSAGALDLTAAGWEDRVDVVTAEPSPDLPGTAFLLRPDGHVAWATDGGTEGAREALTRWFGAPTG